MVKLTRIYTRGGDGGKTSLGDGKRVPKFDLQIAAVGAVEEANAHIGCARLHTTGKTDEMLARIQNDLFDAGADLGSSRDGGDLRGLSAAQVELLETEIDAINKELEPLDSFILPGGAKASAHLHLARTVVRRAERLIVEMAGRQRVNPVLLQYVNRLSDHLFVLARHANNRGQDDVKWRPGENR